MAKGLLISFAGFPVAANSFFPDNGLASLAGILLANGHEVQILDFNTVRVLKKLSPPNLTEELSKIMPFLKSKPDQEVLGRLLWIDAHLDENLEQVATELVEEIAEKVVNQGSQFVGFKLWSGHGFLASLIMARKLHRLFPYLKVIGGGPAVMYSQEAIFSYTDVFDVLVDGEGETAILGLAEWIDRGGKLSNIPNLIYLEGQTVHKTERSWIQDLSQLPLPVYDPKVYPSLDGDDHIKLFILDESRGCPNNCPYCIHKNASGNQWRTKPLNKVFQEIDLLQSLFGASSFRMGGSNTPVHFYESFADKLTESNYHIKYSGFADSGRISQDIITKLAQSGCQSLFFGIESFVESDLIGMKKRTDAGHAIEVIQGCINAAIVPGLSLIVPMPNQPPSSLKANRNILLELCAGTRTAVMITCPALLPRTDWWISRSEYGFSLNVEEDEYKKMLAAYKIRRLIPFHYWQPLPYTVGGMSAIECAQIASQFQKDLADNGVIVDVQDDVVLLAEALQWSLPDIRKKIQYLFFTLDAKEIGFFVRKTNSRLAR